jgi:multimeric flavodoxin WrbA
MPNLLIIYHSLTGGTAQMAHAAAKGAASEPATNTRLLHASGTQPADLLAADSYIFATPENLAAISGVMKDVFDRCYYPCLDQLNGRAYASMVCAGSDGTNAARQIARIATGWRLRQAAEPFIILTHAQTKTAIEAPKAISPQDLAKCEILGATMAASLAMGII